MSIYTKLMNVQNELKVPKNNTNTFGNYKFRNAEDILEALKPLLKKYNATVIITDDVVTTGDRYYIKATVKFIDTETGETIETSALAREDETKKGFDSSQITGSTSSYARKYALNGLFAIDDTKDSDTTNTHGEDKKDNISILSDAQIKRLYTISSKAGYSADKVKSLVKQKYNKEIKQMNRKEYDNVTEGLQRIADARTIQSFNTLNA